MKDPCYLFLALLIIVSGRAFLNSVELVFILSRNCTDNGHPLHLKTDIEQAARNRTQKPVLSAFPMPQNLQTHLYPSPTHSPSPSPTHSPSPSPRTAGAAGAAICAIQKQGLWYIDEWVDYHIALGFQTIFVYDNSDDFELQGWYSKRFHNGTDHVKIVHWPGGVQQLPAYANCTKEIQEHQTHSWIAFIDNDEFFVIKDTKKYPFIMDLLDSVPEEAGGLAVNWHRFDSSNQTKYEAKPLTLRFNHYTINIHVKIIARTNKIKDIGPNPHTARYVNETIKSLDTNGRVVVGPFNDRRPTDVLVLNHYHTKSLEEYKLRCKRGRPTVDMKIKRHRDNYFPCKPEGEILAQWRDEGQGGYFDDNAWKFLKERVPAYRKYETGDTSR